MTVVTVGTTPTLIAAAGNRDFIAIFNNDSNSIFVVFDGGDGAADDGTGLTTSNGFPIPAGTNLILSNDGHRNVWNKAIYGISVAGSANVRVQGA